MTKDTPEHHDTRSLWEKNKNFLIGLAATGVVGIFGLIDSCNTISSGHFGVHTRFGKILNDTISPGVVWKMPLVDDVYALQNNTIILETTAGSGRNTKDQNMLSSEMRLHYTIAPHEGVLALHIDAMSKNNGKDLLTGLMDQSFNAVTGERPASDHMADPKTLLSGFADNLQWREKQNNVPMKVEAIELLTLTVGDGSNPYRMPVQLRIRRIDKDGHAGWTVEKMAGPAALPVRSAGQLINPDESQPIEDTAVTRTRTDSLKL